MLPKKKIGLMSYLLELLGLKEKRATAITESIERMKLADKRLEEIEQVTMSWCVEDLTKEQRKEMGL